MSTSAATVLHATRAFITTLLHLVLIDLFLQCLKSHANDPSLILRTPLSTLSPHGMTCSITNSSGIARTGLSSVNIFLLADYSLYPTSIPGVRPHTGNMWLWRTPMSSSRLVSCKFSFSHHLPPREQHELLVREIIPPSGNSNESSAR